MKYIALWMLGVPILGIFLLKMTARRSEVISFGRCGTSDRELIPAGFRPVGLARRQPHKTLKGRRRRSQAETAPCKWMQPDEIPDTSAQEGRRKPRSGWACDERAGD
jgi:hypothetical protein